MSDNELGDSHSRRNVLKMTGAGLATATGAAGLVQGASSLEPPQNFQATDRRDTEVRLEWDEPESDDILKTEIQVYEWTCGYKGCYSGDHVKTVTEYGEFTWIGNLEPSETYVFRGYTVDGDSNRSDSYSYEQYSTDSTWQDVHTSSSWSQNSNELGGWWSASSFENGDGTVTNDGLYLDYDSNGGTFETYFSDPDGSGSWTISGHEDKSIKLLVRGDEGDEEDDARLVWGTEDGSFDYYAVGQHVSDPYTVLTLPLEYAASYYGSWDVPTPGAFKLNFGRENARDSGLTIERMWVSEYE